MKDDTIPTDVSEEVVVEDVNVSQVDEVVEDDKKFVHPRTAAIEAIVANRQKALAAEISEQEDDHEEEKITEVEKDEQTIIAKVDGITESLTKSELDKRLKEYQKHATADKRLKEASDVIKSAEIMRQEIDERAQRLDKLEKELTLKFTEANKRSEPTSSTPVINPAELAKKLREGEDEEAEEVMKVLVSQLTGTKHSTDDIKSIVASTIREEREAQESKLAEEKRKKLRVEADEAEIKFKEKFAHEIASNSEFFDLAIFHDQKLLLDDEWKNESVFKRYVEAGERAKKLLGLSKQAEKEEKKKGIVNIKSASVREKLKENEKPPVTTADIIKAMKKRRGQMVF